MDNDQQQSLGQKQEAQRREMLRKSLDRVRVLNPTSEDFVVFWDKFPHTVPAKGEAVYPRYVANKYMKEMTDKVLTQRSDKAVKDENEKRVKKGMAAMTKWEEQPVFETQYAIHQPGLRKPVLETLYGGLVEEYGRDLPLQGNQAVQGATSDADLLAEIEAVSSPTVPTLEEELANDNQK